MTDELTDSQKQCLDIHKKKYERNLKTWAIDRALEALKIGGAPRNNQAQAVVEAADILCAWICETPKEWPVPTQDEAEAMLADLRNKGEIS